MTSSNNLAKDTNNWSVWAKFIVNETQRFSKEIESFHSDLKEINKENSELKTEILKISLNSGAGADVFKAEINSKIDALNTDINILKKEIDTKIKELEKENKELKTEIESHKEELDTFSTFKTQIVTTVVILNTIIAIGVSFFTGN